MIPTAALGEPATQARTLRLIDPRSLTRGQRAGRRCAVPNCRRLLADLVYQVGRLPDGRPVLACEECAPGVCYEVSGRCTGQAGGSTARNWHPVPHWG